MLKQAFITLGLAYLIAANQDNFQTKSYFDSRAITWEEEAFRTLCRESSSSSTNEQIADIVRTTLAQNFASMGSFFVVVDNAADAEIGAVVSSDADHMNFPPVCNGYYMHVGVTKKACTGQIETKYFNQYLGISLDGAKANETQMLASEIADAANKLGINAQVVALAGATAGMKGSGDLRCTLLPNVTGAVSYTMYGTPATTADNFDTISHKYICDQVGLDPTITDGALATKVKDKLLNEQGGNDWIVLINSNVENGYDNYTLSTWTMTAKSENFCGKNIYLAGRKTNPTACKPGFPSQAMGNLMTSLVGVADTNVTYVVEQINYYAEQMDLTSQLIVAAKDTATGFDHYDDLSCSKLVKADPWTVYYYGYPN